MQIWHMDTSGWDISKRTPFSAPICYGPVYREPLTDKLSNIAVGLTYFDKGADTTMHTHPGDQIVIYTRGIGRVATEKEEFIVGPGDVVFFPANEPHQHGPAPGEWAEHYGIRVVG